MGLAAIGASLIGVLGRNPFDTYFSGAHFLEDYAEGKREITKLLEMNPTTAKNPT